MTTNNIFLYIPNLIGYFRVLSMVLFCFSGQNYPILSTWLYSVAMICDLFDGMAARKFSQSSTFGAVLDMVTDRFSNAVLLGVLYGLYPTIGPVFLVMITLDLASHWYQMYSTLYCNEGHHKSAKSDYRILEIYYKAPYVLFIMCLTSETAMVNLYVYAFQNSFGSWFFTFNFCLMVICVPFLVLKHIINFIQLMSAAQKINKKELQIKSAK